MFLTIGIGKFNLVSPVFSFISLHLQLLIMSLTFILFKKSLIISSCSFFSKFNHFYYNILSQYFFKSFSKNLFYNGRKQVSLYYLSNFFVFITTKSIFFPGSIAKGSSSKSGCQLHLPTSHANLSRVTSPANFSCQLVESYFTCQLLMPTCRELLHLPTSHVNFLRVTSPANFSCQLFGCYLILLKHKLICRVLLHYPKNTS